ncbi:MAG: ribosome biogenesis GTPase Der [Planctomycetota bacterium]|jgi:GTP-binding protein
MPLPQVAIVGRPNVGKSSLFNWLAGKRIAIVDPTPGVTRDRLSAPVEIGGRYIELTDTGGMGIEDRDHLTQDVERQIRLALDVAGVVLFLVDVRSGPVPLDEHVAEKLRALNKTVILVANKCDYSDLESQVGEFHKFGFGEPLCVSAQQSRNKQPLLDRILAALPAEVEGEENLANPTMKIAIVGRRNTGKSTFINQLADEERTIVSQVEGTTRDSVDVRFERDGRTIVAIDTAGVRYKGKIKDDIEFYSLTRAERSIRRADVVLHFFDSEMKISIVDKQLAGYVLDEMRPAIFVVNKWDLAKDRVYTGEYHEYLQKVFPSLDFVPVAFISAKDNRNVQRVVELAQTLHKQASTRVGTGELNRVLEHAVEMSKPPMRMNRVPKIYFATQVAANPPTIVLFTNGPELFDNTYKRYLLKTFREFLPFKEVPIKMYLRAKERDTSERKKPAGERTKTSKPKKRARDREAGELWDDV